MAGFTLLGIALEPVEWREVWKALDAENKMVLFMGSIAGNMMILIVLSEK